MPYSHSEMKYPQNAKRQTISQESLEKLYTDTNIDENLKKLWPFSKFTIIEPDLFTILSLYSKDKQLNIQLLYYNLTLLKNLSPEFKRTTKLSSLFNFITSEIIIHPLDIHSIKINQPIILSLHNMPYITNTDIYTLINDILNKKQPTLIMITTNKYNLLNIQSSFNNNLKKVYQTTKISHSYNNHNNITTDITILSNLFLYKEYKNCIIP